MLQAARQESRRLDAWFSCLPSMEIPPARRRREQRGTACWWERSLRGSKGNKCIDRSLKTNERGEGSGEIKGERRETSPALF